MLTIVDSWSWDNEREHLLALQEKLNTYFEFVESGQVYEAYPSAIGKSLRIDIVTRYSLPLAAQDFLGKAAAAAAQLEMTILHKCIPSNS